ncbi:hypothetical protein MSPP1_003277 [Malassezia sp. CBS 17886]|nr:hypothetical protein MSPP1_003277 [Malassezia sp. CBS 17886]
MQSTRAVLPEEHGSARAAPGSPPLFGRLATEQPPPYTAVEERQRASSGAPRSGVLTPRGVPSSSVSSAAASPCLSPREGMGLLDRFPTRESDTVSLSSADLALDEGHGARSLSAQPKHVSQRRSLSALRARQIRFLDGPVSPGLTDDELRPHDVGGGARSMMPSFLSRKSYMKALAAKRGHSSAVEPLEPLPTGFLVLLHSLRLFATVPGIIGTSYLLWHALEKLLFKGHWFRTLDAWTHPGGLEYVVSSFWSVCTAFHALSLTTLLLRRWLIYYAVLPSVIRLIAFQSICWSLVRVSLFVAGPSLPLCGWVVISTFTAFADVVVRWITSNITEEHVSESALQSDNYPDTGASDGEGLQTPLSDTHNTHFAPDALRSTLHSLRQKHYRRSRRFLGVIVGGLTDDDDDDTSDSDTETKPGFSGDAALPAHPLQGLNRQSRTGLPNDSDVSHSLSVRDAEAARWRRRIARRDRAQRDARAAARPAHISSFFQNYRAARIHSRRVFHWKVAMRRNVVPIGVLGYLTLWVFLIGLMVQAFGTSMG